MHDRELMQMKLALNALEHALPIVEDFGSKENIQLQHRAITTLHQAIRAALEPEPRPVWFEVTTNIGNKFILDSAVEADKIKAARDEGLSVVPLYTAPPQREWHGLTDKAYEAIAERYVTNCYFDTLKFARAIESKLRRKNT